MIRAVLLTCTAIVVLATILSFSMRETVIGAGLAAIGRSDCPPSEILRAGTGDVRIVKLARRIQQGARIITSDGELGLWDVPGSGRFWMRGPLSALNALVFSELQNEMYFDEDVRVRQGDTVLDCGADYGSFTRAAVNAGAAKVLAIEIDPTKHECLRRTFEQEIAEGRVVIVPLGVWDRVDQVDLIGDSAVLRSDGPKQKVAVTTIDQVVADTRLRRVDFIKFDIEGAEKRALEGARSTLQRFKPRMAFAAEHYVDDYIAIPRAVRQINPDYEVRCGHCRAGGGRFVPSMIYLH